MTARFSFSLDFEIGWGSITTGRWQRREAAGVYTGLRPALREMLAEMEACAVPATWATVGAMFDAPHNRDFSHLPDRFRARIDAAYRAGAPPSFEGRDLFDMVLASTCGHEIACHSYSHIPFDEAGMGAAAVAGELQRFAAALRPFGLVAHKLVFPENRVAQLGVLKSAGYDLFRAPPVPVRLGVLGGPPLLVETRTDDGLTRKSGSLLFNDRNTPWRRKALEVQFERGLRRALRRGGHFHIWAHPFNFSESPGLRQALIARLRQVARLRDQGKIEVVLL